MAATEPPTVVYVSSTTFNLLGLEPALPTALRFVAAIDSFDGGHPGVFVPETARRWPLAGIGAATTGLLGDPQVVEHLRRLRPRHTLMLMFDEAVETLATDLGLRIGLPPAALRDAFDSKLVTTRLATECGVPTVPHVLAEVTSYHQLRSVSAGLGRHLVLQQAYGDSGSTTFFVSDEADFDRHRDGVVGQGVLRVMRRISCRQLTVEGVVARRGTVVGPLMTELVGLDPLTPFRGGWCGNEVLSDDDTDLLDRALRRRAAAMVEAIGEALRRQGYRGCFGLDLLLDDDSRQLYLGELNPRITGATPLTTRACLDAGLPPLLAVHLADLDADLDGRHDAAPAAWDLVEDGPRHSWSQLVVEHLGPGPVQLQAVPASGIHRLDAAGRAVHRRSSTDPVDLVGRGRDDEAFVLRTVEVGQSAAPGQSLARLMLPGRVLDDDSRLTGRALGWIDAVRGLFRPAAVQAGAPGRDVVLA